MRRQKAGDDVDEDYVMMLFRCQDAYQPEEIDEMMELGMQVASYKCFQKIFNRWNTLNSSIRKIILIFQLLQGFCQRPYSRVL